MTTNLDHQASVNTIRALVGDKAGYRERRIMDHSTAKARTTRTYPGCVKVEADFDGDCSFVVRLSDGEIVN